MVYTSESRSLAAPENPVQPRRPARGYSVVRCSFPDTVVEALTPSSLPDGWRQSPAPAGLAAVSDTWVAGASSVVLAVRSAVTPDELNYLLNPRHPDFDNVTIHPPEPYVYDQRLVALTDRFRRRSRR